MKILYIIILIILITCLCVGLYFYYLSVVKGVTTNFSQVDKNKPSTVAVDRDTTNNEEEDEEEEDEVEGAAAGASGATAGANAVVGCDTFTSEAGCKSELKCEWTNSRAFSSCSGPGHPGWSCSYYNSLGVSKCKAEPGCTAVTERSGRGGEKLVECTGIQNKRPTVACSGRIENECSKVSDVCQSNFTSGSCNLKS